MFRSTKICDSICILYLYFQVWHYQPWLPLKLTLHRWRHRLDKRRHPSCHPLSRSSPLPFPSEATRPGPRPTSTALPWPYRHPSNLRCCTLVAPPLPCSRYYAPSCRLHAATAPPRSTSTWRTRNAYHPRCLRNNPSSRDDSRTPHLLLSPHHPCHYRDRKPITIGMSARYVTRSRWTAFSTRAATCACATSVRWRSSNTRRASAPSVGKKSETSSRSTDRNIVTIVVAAVYRKLMS